MKYTCSECGWVRENKEGHWTDEEDYKAIFDHEKEHKNK
tara:strand:- start:80 stop:196 length:117 start_codon:yes stop_codon:yes gene_type:complete